VTNSHVGTFGFVTGGGTLKHPLCFTSGRPILIFQVLTERCWSFPTADNLSTLGDLLWYCSGLLFWILYKFKKKKRC